MVRSRDLPEHGMQAALYSGIAGWAVLAVLSGLIVTTGWRY